MFVVCVGRKASKNRHFSLALWCRELCQLFVVVFFERRYGRVLFTPLEHIVMNRVNCNIRSMYSCVMALQVYWSFFFSCHLLVLSWLIILYTTNMSVLKDMSESESYMVILTLSFSIHSGSCHSISNLCLDNQRILQANVDPELFHFLSISLCINWAALLAWELPCYLFMHYCQQNSHHRFTNKQEHIESGLFCFSQKSNFFEVWLWFKDTLPAFSLRILWLAKFYLYYALIFISMRRRETVNDYLISIECYTF